MENETSSPGCMKSVSGYALELLDGEGVYCIRESRVMTWKIE